MWCLCLFFSFNLNINYFILFKTVLTVLDLKPFWINDVNDLQYSGCSLGEFDSLISHLIRWAFLLVEIMVFLFPNLLLDLYTYHCKEILLCPESRLKWHLRITWYSSPHDQLSVHLILLQWAPIFSFLFEFWKPFEHGYLQYWNLLLWPSASFRCCEYNSKYGYRILKLEGLCFPIIAHYSNSNYCSIPQQPAKEML